MASRLRALCFDARDPLELSHFWAGVLGWEVAKGPADQVELIPSDDTQFSFLFLPVDGEVRGPNQMHFHVTSTSIEDQQATVAKSLRLGAGRVDFELPPEERHVVVTDPDGNELCVIEPGNNFLADCGFFAEVSCDGSRQTGYFWSEALGWPLVWDQNQETAIRSPRGGPKVSWGGTPRRSAEGTGRLHFLLAPATGGDLGEEIARLATLGGTLIASSQPKTGWAVMGDPDGHEFYFSGDAS